MNNFELVWHSWVDRLAKAKKPIIFGVIAVALIGFGILGYFELQKSRTLAAHKAFVSALKFFEAPLKSEGKRVGFQDVVFDTTEEKWKRTAEVFDQGYKNHASSSLAGLFLAYKSQALLNLGKHEEAIAALAAGVDLLPRDLKEGYELKLALLKIDSQNEIFQKSGLDLLTHIAMDEKNHVQDAALYHLGLQFFVKKQFDQAQNYWGQLKLKYGKEQDSDKQSVWAEKAAEKLALIEA